MPMNLLHRRLCSSRKWAAMVAEHLPPTVADAEPVDDVLELGPGYGATTRVLATHVGRLTALEVDEASAARLTREFDGSVDIVAGDGAAMPFDDGRFSAVMCFTMLHHVPSTERQDALFAEARRVLRPGGLLLGVDSLPSPAFRLLHIGDTMTCLDPETLPDRLRVAGFGDVETGHTPGRQIRFRARA